MDPLHRVKLDLIAISEGGCPAHDGDCLYVKKSKTPEFIQLICAWCNDAVVEQMMTPSYLLNAILEFQKAQYKFIAQGYVRIIEKRYKALNIPVYLTDIVIKYYSDCSDSIISELAMNYYYVGYRGFCKEYAGQIQPERRSKAIFNRLGLDSGN